MVAGVLATEIGFLQLYEFCAHMLSSKLAGVEVEGRANGTLRRDGWITRLIAFSGLLRGLRLLLLLLRILIGILVWVRRIGLGERKHG